LDPWSLSLIGTDPPRHEEKRYNLAEPSRSRPTRHPPGNVASPRPDRPLARGWNPGVRSNRCWTSGTNDLRSDSTRDGKEGGKSVRVILASLLRPAVPILAWTLVGLRPVQSGDAGAVDYSRDVKPILAKRCVACHGVLKQKAGLRLDTAARV